MPKAAKSEATDPAASERQRQTGERIRAIRELSGLTQTEVADLCGAGQAQWSRWERGERPAELAAMLKFARRAKTSLDLIYRGIPVGTHEALLRLLQLKVPHLLEPDPTGTGQNTDTDLALYRSSIRHSAE